MSSEVYEFTSQIKAQAFVKSLTKKGLEPGVDFSTRTKVKVEGSKHITIYCVYVYRKLGIFGA